MEYKSKRDLVAWWIENQGIIKEQEERSKKLSERKRDKAHGGVRFTAQELWK